MKNSFLTTLALTFVSTVLASAQTTKVLTPLSSFGPHSDGTLRVGDVAYITTGAYQRGLSYNPATGNLIFVDRQADGNGSPVFSGSIYILDPLTGSSLGTLNPAGMAGGTYVDCAVAVADDGAIYIANMVNSAAVSPYIIYRWNSESDGNPPTIVYSGDPAPGVAPRWGETLDIRGSGANTQIIVASKTQTGGGGTNVVIFTASDSAATNFIPHLLQTDLTSLDGGGSGDPGLAVAFGSGNTFWTKHKNGAPLRQLGFDLATSNATTIRLISTNVLPSIASLGPIAVDNANNLIAVTDLSLPNSVRLYDISNTNIPPVLLDIETFPTSNPNATAAAAYLDFGGGKLYAHSINNGILAMSVESVAMDPPTFITQPGGTFRTAEGRSAYFETFALQATSYQWQRNGSNIPGATNPTFTVSNVTTNNSGAYSVNLINAAGTTFGTSSALLNVVAVSNLFRLSPLWLSSPTSGNTLSPSTGNYINQGGAGNTPNQRTIAYNPLSNQLFVVSRTNNSAQNFSIFVINATNGTYQYSLSTNGLTTSGNVIGLVGIAVADDGAIYACNVDTNVTTSGIHANWRLWRWADSNPTTTPTLVFSGEPTGQNYGMRWGDVLCARGSGTATQVITDNTRINATNATPYVVTLTPTDATMTNFAPVYAALDSSNPFTPIGRSLQFGASGENTVWQKHKGAALVNLTIDPAANSAGNLVTSSAGFPSTLGGVAMDFSRNIAAGIDFNGNASTPDSVALYDISDLNAPLFINRYNFPINQFANGNFIGQVIISGNYLFAIDGNNGLMAFTIASGPAGPPTILSQSGNVRLVSGQSTVLSISSPDATSYQWKHDGSNISGATTSAYSLTNAQMSDAGVYTAVVTNISGATTSDGITVTVVSSNDVYQITQKWPYLPGTNSTGTFTNYLTYNGGSSTPNERSIAYNSLSNQLYVVQKSGTAYAIHVINGDTGVEQYTLDTTGVFIGGSSIALDAIGVADDGAIYVCAMSLDACGCNSADNSWRLYRWADSNPTTQPVKVFDGDPAGQATSLRWGDVMSVRGSGTGTQIVLNNYQGTFGAVLTPTDSSMTVFTNAYFNQTGPGSPIGRSLQFGDGNSVWQKRSGTDLQLQGYDLAAHTSTVQTNYSVFPSSFGPVAVDFARKIVIGINFSASGSPDTVDMYDISTITPPLLLSRKNFPINHQGNQNLFGQVILSGNKVFAVDANNGMVAFDLVAPLAAQLSVGASGNTLTMTWPSSLTGYVLEGNPTLSTAGWTNVTAKVSTNGGQNSVTIQRTGSQQYFRLKK